MAYFFKSVTHPSKIKTYNTKIFLISCICNYDAVENRMLHIKSEKLFSLIGWIVRKKHLKLRREKNSQPQT